MQVNSYKIRSKLFAETHRQYPRINIQASDFLLSKQPITVAEVDIGIDPEFLALNCQPSCRLISTPACNARPKLLRSTSMSPPIECPKILVHEAGVIHARPDIRIDHLVRVVEAPYF
jgi:hypothetical protein